jgi:hypothetical protein
MRYFYFYPVSGEPIQKYAEAAGGRLGLSPEQISQNTLPRCPEIAGLAEFIVRFPESRRALIMRYWQAQEAYYTPRVEQAYGPAVAGTIGKQGIVALTEPWRDFAASTICFNMATDAYGVLIVFSDATVGDDGQLLWNGKAGDLPLRNATPFPFPTAPAAATAVAVGDDNSIVWNALADQLKFIGIGLTLLGGPGSIFTALFSFISTFISPSNDIVDKILNGIETLLQRNNIKIEIDFAQSAVETWAGWERIYYLESDFKLLSDPKSPKDTPQYKQALGRANTFIDKLHDDFLGTPRIFDAVNLMKADPTIDPNNLDYPNAAMLKFSSFLFFSTFILVLGKKAWLYSQQINGVNDQKTMDLANAVAGYSSQYTPYAFQVKTAIDTQIQRRSGMLSIAYDVGHPRWYIADSYQGGNEQGSWPAAWGFQGRLGRLYLLRHSRLQRETAGRAERPEPAGQRVPEILHRPDRSHRTRRPQQAGRAIRAERRRHPGADQEELSRRPARGSARQAGIMLSSRHPEEPRACAASRRMDRGHLWPILRGSP